MTPIEIAEKVMLRLNLQEEDRPLVEDYAAEVLERVENFIHDGVPQGLFYTCVRMTVGLYQASASSALGMTEGIQSISEGDTTFTYRDGAKSRQETLSALMVDAGPQLVRYRKGLFPL